MIGTLVFLASFAAISSSPIPIINTPVDLPPIAIIDEGRASQSNYCGLYCLAAIARRNGIEVNTDKLFQPRFLTGEYGSSIENLKEASSMLNLRLSEYQNLTYWDLSEAKDPILCLIATNPNLNIYNHWVLVLSVRNGRICVFDSDAGEVVVPPSEFLTLWSGIGLTINPKEQQRFRLATVCPQIIIASNIIIIICAIILFSANRFGLRASIFMLFSVSICFSLAFHVLAPVGFLNRANSFSQFDHRPPSSITRLPLTESSDWQPTKDYIIIDVRTPQQFASGHIENALNLPISSSSFAVSSFSKDIPLDRHIVFYCESINCTWAETMAQMAQFCRFAKVSVIPGGFESYYKLGLPIAH